MSNLVNENTVTILRGKNKIVGLYLNGELACTHDKHTTPDEFEYSILAHGGKGCAVREQDADFKTYGGIPLRLDSDETLQATLDAEKKAADRDSERREEEKALTIEDAITLLQASQLPAREVSPVEVLPRGVSAQIQCNADSRGPDSLQVDDTADINPELGPKPDKIELIKKPSKKSLKVK